MTSIVFAAATTLAQAQAPAPKPAPEPKTTTHSDSSTTKSATADQDFARKVAAGGMAEVELAKLAQQKSSSEEVKSLAQRLETDHSKANDELKALASKKGWDLPTTPTSDQAAKKASLEKLSGSAFDKQYVDLMVSNHRTNINAFQHQASKGTDADLKQWASSTLPTLKEHLDMATKAQKSLGSSSSTKYSSKSAPAPAK
jgi:putative membrane protein